MKFKFFKRLSRGKMMPPFYGVVFFDMASDEGICCPVFLNIIVKVLRDFYLYIKLCGREIRWDSYEAYYQGLQEGFKRKLDVKPIVDLMLRCQRHQNEIRKENKKEADIYYIFSERLMSALGLNKYYEKGEKDENSDIY